VQRFRIEPRYDKLMLLWLRALADEGLLEAAGDSFSSPAPLPEPTSRPCGKAPATRS